MPASTKAASARGGGGIEAAAGAGVGKVDRPGAALGTAEGTLGGSEAVFAKGLAGTTMPVSRSG